MNGKALETFGLADPNIHCNVIINLFRKSKGNHILDEPKHLYVALFLVLFGVIAASMLVISPNIPFRPYKTVQTTGSKEKYAFQTPSFPSELKEIFPALIPSEEEIEVEIRRFKEARGYEPEAIVIGVPFAIYSRDKIQDIIAKVEKLWREGYPMQISWTLIGNVCSCYAVMLAEEIGTSSVPSKVLYMISGEERTKALEIIEAFKSRNLSVWIKSSEGRAKFVEAPPSLDEEILDFLLNASQTIYEGKNVPGIITEGSGEGNWARDKIYHGWICVFNYGFNHKWWFWRECSTSKLSGCREEGPSELEACDIHYMREMYFYGEMGRTNGLINFPGCEPAKNPEKCNGSCGVINTLWMGECDLSFSKLPLDREIYLIYASYIPTHTKKDPFPYLSYCGCLGSCPDPQLFIIEIKYVFSP